MDVVLQITPGTRDLPFPCLLMEPGIAFLEGDLSARNFRALKMQILLVHQIPLLEIYRKEQVKTEQEDLA